MLRGCACHVALGCLPKFCLLSCLVFVIYALLPSVLVFFVLAKELGGWVVTVKQIKHYVCGRALLQTDHSPDAHTTRPLEEPAELSPIRRSSRLNISLQQQLRSLCRLCLGQPQHLQTAPRTRGEPCSGQ